MFGIDFSGAADAGRRTWIARGTVPPGGPPAVQECRSADSLPGSGPRREAALEALRSLIGRERGAVFGLDVPFGLPAPLAAAPGWEEFVTSFPERYREPEGFRRACLASAGGVELKRAADRAARTPFSPYNLRLYRQTFFGIREVLAPLVRSGAARALPMQAPDPGKPWLLEVCPASTLKRTGLYQPYKGRDPARRAARRRILESLEGRGELAPLPPEVRRAAVEDPAGDALDSLLAFLAAARGAREVLAAARLGPAGEGSPAVEGWVFS